MTETVNVLPHIRELKDAWRRQDFVFTKQQQEQYDLLITARRERVKYFYDNDMVCKISKSAMDKLKEDNWQTVHSSAQKCWGGFTIDSSTNF